MQENSSMAERGQREEMKQKASPCPRERRRDSKTGNRSGVKSEENKRYACKGSQSPAVYHAKVTKKKKKSKQPMLIIVSHTEIAYHAMIRPMRPILELPKEMSH